MCCVDVEQKRVRDARASYLQSLAVLKAAKETGVYTKSSIMLGLGESDDEIIDTMLDLRDAGDIPQSSACPVQSCMLPDMDT